MSLIGKILSTLMGEITNHSDYLLQKLIAAGSLFSLPFGLVLGLSNDTIQKIQQTTTASAPLPPDALGFPDYAAIVSITLGVCGIIQICVNIYYKIKNGGKS